ncbi:hypothetical protein C5E07_05780 [Pseudoclavibacter sp. RFBJ3]|uniref:hypothetical protein n=1 Tax=unclassified Pseudoclavibacter TaxID=2615177 RepID=UPI000CE8B932|nr:MULTISPECIES: hypothetical protein [unclassified Pseudoclavibacter]PPF85001.1 hypothetical protein C5C12_06490 [Pseudoclavibacter sp. RFBJ5]PPF94004.1 hypothetical protein C5E07_05780 [Pseudoclavibacter sp. RFBJ3]PPF98721.1 hypothetical protein C5C19_08765 [Pseudoclavibacter sp. RFBH5]PPG24318.1 hypothetical protein C5E13_06105 [Pseudoclavibacter sp. RFBI4]
MSFNYRSSNLLAAVRCWLAAVLLIAVPPLVGGLTVWFHVTSLVIGLALVVPGWLYFVRFLRNRRQRRRLERAQRMSKLAGLDE